MLYSGKQVAEDAKRWRTATDGIADAVAAERLNGEEVSALLVLIRQLDEPLSQEHCRQEIGTLKKNYKYHPVGDPDSKILLENLKAFVAICTKYLTKTDKEFQLLKAELKGGSASAGSSGPPELPSVARAIPVAALAAASSSTPLPTARPVVPPHPVVSRPAAPPAPPRTYLWQSVACVFLCCFPFAVPAIIKGAKVGSFYRSGDYAAAESASNSARFWMYVSLGTGILFHLFCYGIQGTSRPQAPRAAQRPAPGAPQTQGGTESVRRTPTIGEILKFNGGSSGISESAHSASGNAPLRLEDAGSFDRPRREDPSDPVFHPVGSPLEHRGAVRSVAFSPDSSRVVTASLDNTVRVWETATGQPAGAPKEHADTVRAARFSPDGERILTTSGRMAQFWDVERAETIGPPLRHKRDIVSVSFCPNGCHVATAGEDNAAQVWKTDTGESVGQPLSHEGINSAEFSPDGRWVVTAGNDRTAQLWQASTGKRASLTLLHKEEANYYDGIQRASFTPDGRRILTIGRRFARVWDGASGATVGEPIQHGSDLFCAVASPDGRRIVTAATDDTVRLWDADTGKPIGQPMKHRRALRFALFSPDGRLIVTGSDEMARVWNAETGEPVGKPLEHRRAVFSAVFSPDGRWIATASQDATARVWKVPSSLVPTTSPKPVETTSLDFDIEPRTQPDNASIASNSTPSEAIPSQSFAGEKMEVWTDTNGRTLEAALVRATDTKVVLRGADGKEREIPLEKFSPESRARATSGAEGGSGTFESDTLAAYERLFAQLVRTPDRSDPRIAALLAAAERGDHEAEAMVGESYYDGIGGFPVNSEEAHAWFTRASRGGNVLGDVGLAMLAIESENASSHSSRTMLQRARPRLEQILATGNGKAAYFRAAAVCYIRGGGRASDAEREQAVQWLRHAASLKDVQANFMIGDILLSTSVSHAVIYLKHASEQGSAAASTRLAMHCFGDGNDIALGIRLLRSAALKGDIDAQIVLGGSLGTGTNVEEDSVEAAFWLQLAKLRAIRFGRKRQETDADVLIEKCRSRSGNGPIRRAVEFFGKKGSVAASGPSVAPDDVAPIADAISPTQREDHAQPIQAVRDAVRRGV